MLDLGHLQRGKCIGISNVGASSTLTSVQADAAPASCLAKCGIIFLLLLTILVLKIFGMHLGRRFTMTPRRTIRCFAFWVLVFSLGILQMTGDHQ